MSSGRWVLFDLDGTLFDYEAAETAAVVATLEEAGLVGPGRSPGLVGPEPAAGSEVVRRYREINARHWRALERGETAADRLRVERWEDLLRACGLPETEATTLARRYVAHLATRSQLVEGAVEVVEEVARSHRIGFVTNGLADVQRPRLAASPLGRFAEVVVISDEVGAAKPAPEFFDAAFVRMGSPSRDAVVLVGDSLSSDVAGGVNYGLETVWVAPSELPDPEEPRPTHRIGDLRELTGVLAR